MSFSYKVKVDFSGGFFFFFLEIFIYLFLERGSEGEREGEKRQCVLASHAPPYWGPGPQPKHVP